MDGLYSRKHVLICTWINVSDDKETGGDGESIGGSHTESGYVVYVARAKRGECYLQIHLPVTSLLKANFDVLVVMFPS